MLNQTGDKAYWDYNKYIAKSLAAQKADYILGAIFLCLSFSAQLLSGLIHQDILQLKASHGEAALLLAACTVVPFSFSFCARVLLKASIVKEIIKVKREEHRKYIETKKKTFINTNWHRIFL